MNTIEICDSRSQLKVACEDLKAIRSVLLTVSDHDEYDNAAYALRVIDRALRPIIHDIQEAIEMIDKSL